MGRPKLILDIEEITINAAEIIREYGHETLSMRKLSEKLKIGTMTLYGYFENKEVLLKSVIVKEYKNLWKTSRAYALEKISSEDNALFLYRYIFESVSDFAIENPNIYLLLFDPEFNVFKDEPEILALYSSAPDYIDESLKDGVVDIADIRNTVYMYEVLMNSLIMNLLTHRGQMNQENFEAMSLKAYDLMLKPLEKYYNTFGKK